MGLEEVKVKDFLSKKIQDIDYLKFGKSDYPKFKRWKTRYSPSFPLSYTPDSNFDKAYQKGLDDVKEILKGIVSEIETFGILSQNQKNLKNTGSKNIFNITQNQSVNVTLENTLKNHLTVNQYDNLKTILEERDKNKKSKGIIKFLKGIGEKSLIEIIKSLLI